MEKNKLSQRLLSVGNMVTASYRFVDVGCDHGFLAIYLIGRGAPCGIASDVRPGPLSAAKEHIKEAGLLNVIETRLCDGIKGIKVGEGESLIIAGMGGPLILKILAGNAEVRDSMKEIIIEPQSMIKQVREGLDEQKLFITDEDFVYEDGKYYPVIKLKPENSVNKEDRDFETAVSNTVRERIHFVLKQGEITKVCNLDNADADYILSKIRIKYGLSLVEKKHPVLMDYLDYEVGILNEIRNNLEKSGHDEKLSDVLEQIELNRLTKNLCE